MALITKTDIEDELQTTLAAGYTTAIINRITDWAHSKLVTKTHRSTFSGNAADIAKYAEVCLAIDRLVTSNRELAKTFIQSISENGRQITFTNGKTLQSYRDEAEEAFRDLALPGSSSTRILFPDTEDTHTGDEGSIYY